jgi:potassium voltage-gated channel Eag-related subfamily H protein 2
MDAERKGVLEDTERNGVLEDAMSALAVRKGVMVETMVSLDLKPTRYLDVEHSLEDVGGEMEELSSIAHSNEGKQMKWPNKARASFYHPSTKDTAEDQAIIDVGLPLNGCLYSCFFGPTVPLQPTDTLIRNWEGFMMLLLLYVTFVTTYEIAFVKREELILDGLFWTNRFVDFGFVFDLWVNFNVAFTDEEGSLVSSKKLVRNRYLRGWFPLDILALLPFGMIGFLMNSDEVKDMAFMRLIRLLRLMKLARLMKASRIINKVMMSSDLLMRQWAFFKTFLLLALFFHWSVCALLILTDLEGADPNWMSVVTEKQNPAADEEAVAEAVGRFLKSGGSGGSDSEIVVETNWYLEASKYSLAVFGVWAFEPPEMVTLFENWYSVLMTIFAASFYAYLAGVIVELVSMAGAANRATNQKLDGIMMYLEEIGYPKPQRQIYKQFFWSCRHHFLHEYYLSMLPALSPELSGRLALFHYGENLKKVPFFQSSDGSELLRFQSLVSRELQMRAFSALEEILVDSLHLLCEGLVGFQGRVFHQGSSFGYQQCLDQRAPPASGSSVTFVMCMTLQPEALWEILRTGPFYFCLLLLLRLLLPVVVMAGR